MDTHILAVDIAAFDAGGGLNHEDFFDTPGLAWCGDTFETGYVFSEQITTLFAPMASPELSSILRRESVAFSHPIVDAFGTLDEEVELTPLTPAHYQELRAVVRQALDQADWGTDDTYEWDQLLTDEHTTGDFYLIAEFV